MIGILVCYRDQSTIDKRNVVSSQTYNITFTLLVTHSEEFACNSFQRWLTVNVYYVNFIRNAMKIVNEGPSPPAVLSLSDGGHIENLGILPLLKLRLKKIVSVDGSRTILDQDYGSSLMAALDLARRKLGCSFSGMDGRDIAEDIRDNFVERRLGSHPRSYRSVS